MRTWTILLGLLVLLTLTCGCPSDDPSDDDTAMPDDHDDQDSAVYPGAAEICDGKDNDCDGSPALYEADNDGDGWTDCEDWDDTDPNVYPGQGC